MPEYLNRLQEPGGGLLLSPADRVEMFGSRLCVCGHGRNCHEDDHDGVVAGPYACCTAEGRRDSGKPNFCTCAAYERISS
jgi:hypothetical protein